MIEFFLGAGVVAALQIGWDLWQARQAPLRKVSQKDYYRICTGCTMRSEVGRKES